MFLKLTQLDKTQLDKMEGKELKSLINWLEMKTMELKKISKKPLPSKDYSKIYTSRLLK